MQQKCVCLTDFAEPLRSGSRADYMIPAHGFLREARKLCASTRSIQWHLILVTSNIHMKSTQVKVTLLAALTLRALVSG